MMGQNGPISLDDEKKTSLSPVSLPILEHGLPKEIEGPFYILTGTCTGEESPCSIGLSSFHQIVMIEPPWGCYR